MDEPAVRGRPAAPSANRSTRRPTAPARHGSLLGAADPVVARVLQVLRDELGVAATLHLRDEIPLVPPGHVALEVTDDDERLGALVLPETAAGDAAQLVARLLGARIAGRREHHQRRRAARRRVAEMLEAGGITCRYQPIVSLGTGEAVGVEALMRLRHHDPVGGPQEWLRAASDHGLRGAVERRALAQALSALPHLPERLLLSVNLSAPVLAADATTELLRQAPLSRVVVELTERDAVADYERLNLGLAPLRAQGLRLAIDDVGAGFASLRHVLRTRPDIVKLDRAFVAELGHDRAAESLIASLLAFAGDLGATVVAEGVEAPETRRGLEQLGVPWAQGYLFGAPEALPATLGHLSERATA